MERYHFVFNGTLYNHQAMAKKLMANNIFLHTSSDTEIAFHCLIHFGYKQVKEWDGMFSFIFYDAKEKVVWIRRDPLGIKPLYYTLLNGYIAFSSETKSFFHFPDWSFDVENEKVFHFLSTGEREINGDPFWKKAKAVPTGCTLIVRRLNNRPFYMTEWCDDEEKTNHHSDPDPNLSFRQVSILGKELLEKAICTHLQGNGPVGLSLSGGLDSSLLFSYLKRLIPHKLLCVITYNEVEKTGLISLKNSFTGDYHSLPKLPFDLFQTLHEEIITLSEGPLPGPNAVHHFHIYRYAKQLGMKIMLSGQGADELFLGYPAAIKHYWQQLNADKAFIKLFQEVLWTSLLRCDLYIPMLHFLKNKKNNKTYQADFTVEKIRNKTLFNNNLPYLLHAEDRHGLANNIEVRVPFLDNSFQAFARNLPYHFSIHHGKQKWLLRAMGESFLPKKILTTYEKKGFPATIPFLSQKEQTIFLHELNAFIQKNRLSYPLPTNQPPIILKKYPALAWRMNSVQKWISLFNVDMVQTK
jgi:asparagine synthase (glutamine-hydrolysing)